MCILFSPLGWSYLKVIPKCHSREGSYSVVGQYYSMRLSESSGWTRPILDKVGTSCVGTSIQTGHKPSGALLSRQICLLSNVSATKVQFDVIRSRNGGNRRSLTGQLGERKQFCQLVLAIPNLTRHWSI